MCDILKHETRKKTIYDALEAYMKLCVELMKVDDFSAPNYVWTNITNMSISIRKNLVSENVQSEVEGNSGLDSSRDLPHPSSSGAAENKRSCVKDEIKRRLTLKIQQELMKLKEFKLATKPDDKILIKKLSTFETIIEQIKSDGACDISSEIEEFEVIWSELRVGAIAPQAEILLQIENTISELKMLQVSLGAARGGCNRLARGSLADAVEMNANVPGDLDESIEEQVRADAELAENAVPVEEAGEVEASQATEEVFLIPEDGRKMHQKLVKTVFLPYLDNQVAIRGLDEFYGLTVQNLINYCLVKLHDFFLQET